MLSLFLVLLLVLLRPLQKDRVNHNRNEDGKEMFSLRCTQHISFTVIWHRRHDEEVKGDLSSHITPMMT